MKVRHDEVKMKRSGVHTLVSNQLQLLTHDILDRTAESSSCFL